MKAAVWKGLEKGFQLEQVPEPKPGAGEVLIKVRYCGICGTDLHLIDAGLIPEGAVMGHEVTGKIAGLGSGIKDLKVEDLVAIRPYAPCGHCPACLGGRPNICPQALENAVGFGKVAGGFAEYLVVKRTQVWKLPKEVSPREGTLAEPLASAVRAVKRSGAKIGDSALILGGGPMGALVGITLRAAGAHLVVVSEPVPRRRNIIKNLRFRAVVDPEHADVLKYFDDTPWKKPLLVFDCAGRKESLAQAIELCAPGGKVVMASLSWEPVPINSMTCLSKELELLASFSYFEEFEAALDIITSDLFDFHSLITSIIPLEELPSEISRVRFPSSEMKVLVQI